MRSTHALEVALGAGDKILCRFASINRVAGYGYIRRYTLTIPPCLHAQEVVPQNRRQASMAPPQWYGSPGSTPFPSICKLLAAFLRSSLVFARFLQRFWLPASHLLGTCDLLNDLRSTHTPSKYLRTTYGFIYMCYVSTSSLSIYIYYRHTHIYIHTHTHIYTNKSYIYICKKKHTHTYIYMHIPVVPQKAVAEVSKIGNL